jgi:hypothetical protein
MRHIYRLLDRERGKGIAAIAFTQMQNGSVSHATMDQFHMPLWISFTLQATAFTQIWISFTLPIRSITCQYG